MMIKTTLLCSVLSVVTAFSVHAQPELDTSFAGDGKTRIIFGALASADDIVVQPDNKIVMVSSCGHLFMGFVPICLARVNEDGSLDETFRSSPEVLGVFTLWGADVTGVTIQNDGKIVAVGYGVSGNEVVTMVRYNADGSLDTTFGSGGKLSTDITPGSDTRGKKVMMQPDGKILIVGRTGATQFIARYLTDGTLDASFGIGGVAKASLPGITNNGLSIALQPDGKVLAGGGTTTSYLITRWNSDGTPDTSWDGDGIATVGTGGAGEIQGFRSIALQTDGRVVAAGHNNILYRFNSNGSIDTSFDGDGSRQALENPFAGPHDVMISPGGRITVVGERIQHTGPGTVPYHYLTARYLSDGSPDPSYSDDGLLDIDVDGNDGAWAVAADRFGRIVMAGRSATGTTASPWEQSVFSVARVLAPPNAAVGISGRITGPDGFPMARTIVSVLGGGGGRTTITNPFGFYSFENLQVGQLYTVSVHVKGLEFDDQVVFLGDSITNLDFEGQVPTFGRSK